MKNYKNYLIALLTGLLVLSLTTHNAIGAGPSKDEKIINYQTCLTKFLDGVQWFGRGSSITDIKQDMQYAQITCYQYRP